LLKFEPGISRTQSRNANQHNATFDDLPREKKFPNTPEYLIILEVFDERISYPTLQKKRRIMLKIVSLPGVY